MTVTEAQREVRDVFVNGSVGQLVSGLIWLAAAAFGTWGTTRQAIIVLIVAGCFIFPLTQLALRLAGHAYSLSRGNPFNALGMQVAFVAPLCLPLAYGAALYNINWFFPALLIIIGAHYLPFITLYGMWQYGALGGLMVGGGFLFGLLLPHQFAVGGWFGAGCLLVFAAWGALLRRKPAA